MIIQGEDWQDVDQTEFGVRGARERKRFEVNLGQKMVECVGAVATASSEEIGKVGL